MRELIDDRRVLVIAAHPDDADWSVYGMVQRAAVVEVLVLTDGGEIGRTSEAHDALVQLGCNAGLTMAREKCNYLDESTAATTIADVIGRSQPHVILTHDVDDGHQDHRAAARATEIATRYRPHVVLSYPSPSAWSFDANVIVPITRQQLEVKVDAVQQHRSQMEKPYMRPEVVRANAAWYGRYSLTGYAEALRWMRGMG